MSKYIVVYYNLCSDADEVDTVLASEFSDDESLIKWLLRWSSTVSILAVSRNADLDDHDYGDEVIYS